MVLFQYTVEFHGGCYRALTFYENFLEMLASAQEAVRDCKLQGQVNILIDVDVFYFGFDGTWPALRVNPTCG